MPRVIITIPEKTPQPYRFSLDRQVVKLGRGSNNDIVIDSGSVSVDHAEMRRVEGGFEIEDLGSTNGMKCEGRRQMKFALTSGVKVFLGDVEFDFTLSDEEQAELAKEATAVPRPETKKAAPEPEMQASVDVEYNDKPKPRRSSSAKPVDEESSSVLATVVMFLLFFILAGASFYAGAEIRHQRDTGESLLESINKKDVDSKKADADGSMPTEK